MKSLTTLASSAALLSLAHAQSGTDCVSGVHVIVARGSDEPPGEGIIGAVANNVTSRIANSDAVAVPYPATIDNYVASENAGVGNMTKLIESYGDQCPSGKIVLMGYSQGAQVIADTLIGNPGPLFNVDTDLPSKYLNQILAVIMMGDPTYVPGLPFNVGNATKSGTFERKNTNEWAARGLDSRIQSYCDANDLFCSSGDSLIVHVGYVAEYGAKAVDFVVEKFQQAGGNSTSSSTSSASGSSSTSAASGSASSSLSSAAATSSAGGSGSSSSSASAIPSSSSAASSSSGSGTSGSGSSASSSSTPTTTPQTGAATGLRSSAAGFAVAGLLAAVVAFAL